MLWIKAFHIIAMVAWFAGLFYLPRLFVYHVETSDHTGQLRFQTMEAKLYYAITWPAAIVTTALGLWLMSFNPHYYLTAPWMHLKLTAVGLLWIFHGLCGYYLRQFAHNNNPHSATFYRVFNEIPTLLLVVIVLLVILKPAI